MSLKTEHLANCLATLESSLQRLRTTPKEEKIEYENRYKNIFLNNHDSYY